MTIEHQYFKRIKCNRCPNEKGLCKTEKDFTGWLSIYYSNVPFDEKSCTSTTYHHYCPSCAGEFYAFVNDRRGIAQ